MSTVGVSAGRAVSSSQVHRWACPSSVSMTNSHRSGGTGGVGPADSTGKPCSRYCPGGSRSPPSPRRPRKPREMTLMETTTAPPEGGEKRLYRVLAVGHARGRTARRRPHVLQVVRLRTEDRPVVRRVLAQQRRTVAEMQGGVAEPRRQLARLRQLRLAARERCAAELGQLPRHGGGAGV